MVYKLAVDARVDAGPPGVKGSAELAGVGTSEAAPSAGSVRERRSRASRPYRGVRHVENLSREHAGDFDTGSDANVVAEVEAAPSVLIEAHDGGPVHGARSFPAETLLAASPADAPPPGLWSKLEAQLRREGIIK